MGQPNPPCVKQNNPYLQWATTTTSTSSTSTSSPDYFLIPNSGEYCKYRPVLASSQLINTGGLPPSPGNDTGTVSNTEYMLIDNGDYVSFNRHPFVNGSVILLFDIQNTLGIQENTPYYVVAATTNTFQISETLNGSAVTFTNNGSALIALFGGGFTPDPPLFTTTTTTTTTFTTTTTTNPPFGSCISATGGDEVLDVMYYGQLGIEYWKLHIFRQNGTFTVHSNPNNHKIHQLVVGGGGGGGKFVGGTLSNIGGGNDSYPRTDGKQPPFCFGGGNVGFAEEACDCAEVENMIGGNFLPYGATAHGGFGMINNDYNTGGTDVTEGSYNIIVGLGGNAKRNGENSQGINISASGGLGGIPWSISPISSASYELNQNKYEIISQIGQCHAIGFKMLSHKYQSESDPRYENLFGDFQVDEFGYHAHISALHLKSKSWSLLTNTDRNIYQHADIVNGYSFPFGNALTSSVGPWYMYTDYRPEKTTFTQANIVSQPLQVIKNKPKLGFNSYFSSFIVPYAQSWEKEPHPIFLNSTILNSPYPLRSISTDLYIFSRGYGPIVGTSCVSSWDGSYFLNDGAQEVCPREITFGEPPNETSSILCNFGFGGNINIRVQVADSCVPHHGIPLAMLNWPHPGAGGDGQLSFISEWSDVQYDQFGIPYSGISNELGPQTIQGLDVPQEIVELNGRGQDGIVIIAYRSC